MKLAMVVSEMTPFAKTGGLADVAGALPLALAKLGIEVHLFLPRYLTVKTDEEQLPIADRVTVHWIDHETYFKRPGLYGEGGTDYPDNLDRFSFFCRASLARMKREDLRVHLLHAHDWQTALTMVYLRSRFKADPFFSSIRTVFTVHNLGYQGIFPKEEYPKLGLPWELFTLEGLEFYNQVNLLKGGLLFADRLTTVSPNYSKEICTGEQGYGLEGLLRKRSHELVGILNGIDSEIWNPATDRFLPFRYDAASLAEKMKNKLCLQKELKLEPLKSVPLMGMVTRLASQKGLDLVVEAFPDLVKRGVQLVLLGSGDRSIEKTLQTAGRGIPSVRVRLGFDEGLAHRIYAGADLFLMPSRYEPCGLGQMIAMRYGTLPLVRATGGLADTVIDEGDSPSSGGNGFCFEEYGAKALLQAVDRALAVYRNPPRWQALQHRGMTTDFSWDRSAEEYRKLYENLMGSDPTWS